MVKYSNEQILFHIQIQSEGQREHRAPISHTKQSILPFLITLCQPPLPYLHPLLPRLTVTPFTPKHTHTHFCTSTHLHTYTHTHTPSTLFSISDAKPGPRRAVHIVTAAISSMSNLSCHCLSLFSCVGEEITPRHILWTAERERERAGLKRENDKKIKGEGKKCQYGGGNGC